MKFNLAKKRLTNFEHQRNMLLGFSSVLLLIMLVMSLCLFFKSERVIILPPEVRREFWSEGNRFSPEYLEEMAIYFVHLSFDVNQTTLPYNTEILSRYASTQAASYLRSKYEKDIKKLKKNNASTTFEVQEVVVYPERNVVQVSGLMNKYVGAHKIKDSKDIYEVHFEIHRGRLFFKKMKQIEGDKDED